MKMKLFGVDININFINAHAHAHASTSPFLKGTSSLMMKTTYRLSCAILHANYLICGILLLYFMPLERYVVIKNFQQGRFLKCQVDFPQCCHVFSDIYPINPCIIYSLSFQIINLIDL